MTSFKSYYSVEKSKKLTFDKKTGRQLKMKMPKQKRIYCPRCNEHTDHKVSIYKKGKDSSMVRGKLRFERKKKGYGSKPKPVQHNQCKLNKKTRPMYKCSKCGFIVMGKAQRLKKFEILNK